MSHALADGLRYALGILEGGHRAFALIGGLAVSARSEPRFTRDADFAVSVGSDAEAEDDALVRAGLVWVTPWAIYPHAPRTRHCRTICPSG